MHHTVQVEVVKTFRYTNHLEKKKTGSEMIYKIMIYHVQCVEVAFLL